MLSTGNSFTEINLNRSQNTLIVGSNGAGKSTLLDVLCFVLFNKPFRKINKTQLLNSINGKDCVGEIEFSIGKKKYKVIRGIKPAVFEIYIDDILLNQDAKTGDYQDYLEKVILKMNFKSFTQVVILGSASFVPFMQLSAGDRRSIIEDLLDIQIFSSMNVVVKSKLALIKDEYAKNKSAMDLVSERIKMLKNSIEQSKQRNDDDIQKLTSELETNDEQLQVLYGNTNTLQNKISDLNREVTDKVSVETKSKKLIQLEAKLEANIAKLESDISFYEHNDNCPTCKQSLELDFKTNQVVEKTNRKCEVEKGIVELNKELDKVNSRYLEIQNINKEITELNNELIRCNSTILSINKYIIKLNKDIKDIKDKKDTSDEDSQKMKNLKSELSSLIKTQEDLAQDKQYYEFSATLLKDTGIKAKIIKQYLPVMNKLINKYLTAMDFFANFNLNESFEETIKSRHRDDFSYSNFSEGEKQKIDLALLLTWRHIAKMKNSTNTNLLMLDEIFDSSLDANSAELLMNILNEMKDTNIFVISHKGDQLFDKFRSMITFVKKNNFSEIVK
jgi:DNA repair exonuclease SbcCD ATPase subunit